MLPANENDPAHGLLEHPGVFWTLHGGADLLATTITVRFADEAIDSLAERFSCSPDALVIMGEIVDGLRRIYGHDAVTVKQVLRSGGSHA